jgi:hypothetical protein
MIPFMIDKILSYTSVSNKGKIDRLLELDATMYCNLGTDSTQTEKQEVKRTSRAIYRAIKTLDKGLGDSLLHFMDK